MSMPVDKEGDDYESKNSSYVFNPCRNKTPAVKKKKTGVPNQGALAALGEAPRASVSVSAPPPISGGGEGWLFQLENVDPRLDRAADGLPGDMS